MHELKGLHLNTAFVPVQMVAQKLYQFHLILIIVTKAVIEHV